MKIMTMEQLVKALLSKGYVQLEKSESSLSIAISEVKVESISDVVDLDYKMYDSIIEDIARLKKEGVKKLGMFDVSLDDLAMLTVRSAAERGLKKYQRQAKIIEFLPPYCCRENIMEIVDILTQNSEKVGDEESFMEISEKVYFALKKSLINGDDFLLRELLSTDIAKENKEALLHNLVLLECVGKKKNGLLVCNAIAKNGFDIIEFSKSTRGAKEAMESK